MHYATLRARGRGSRGGPQNGEQRAIRGYGREARDEADRAERASHTAFPRSAFGGTVASHRSFAPPLQPHPQPGHSLGKRACAVPKYPVNYVGCTQGLTSVFQRFSARTFPHFSRPARFLSVATIQCTTLFYMQATFEFSATCDLDGSSCDLYGANTNTRLLQGSPGPSTLQLLRCLLQTASRCELGCGDRHDWIKRHE